MSVQFLQELIDDVHRELREMRERNFDRVRVMELGIIRAFLILKQSALADEMEEHFCAECGDEV